MRKTNKNTERAEFLKKALIYSVVIQASILLFFIPLYLHNQPTKSEDCENIVVTVEDVSYVRGYRDSNCHIFSQGVEYEFPNYGIFAEEYTGKELSEVISVGESVNIRFVKKIWLFGSYNYIVDARNENNVYLDYDTYFAQAQGGCIGIIILFSIFELLFLAGLIFSFVLNRDYFIKKDKKSKR